MLPPSMTFAASKEAGSQPLGIPWCAGKSRNSGNAGGQDTAKRVFVLFPWEGGSCASQPPSAAGRCLVHRAILDFFPAHGPAHPSPLSDPHAAASLVTAPRPDLSPQAGHRCGPLLSLQRCSERIPSHARNGCEPTTIQVVESMLQVFGICEGLLRLELGT